MFNLDFLKHLNIFIVKKKKKDKYTWFLKKGFMMKFLKIGWVFFYLCLIYF